MVEHPVAAAGSICRVLLTAAAAAAPGLSCRLRISVQMQRRHLHLRCRHPIGMFILQQLQAGVPARRLAAAYVFQVGARPDGNGSAARRRGNSGRATTICVEKPKTRSVTGSK